MWWDFTTLQRIKGSQSKRNWLGGSGKGSIFPRLSPPQNLLLPPCAKSSKCLPWADCSLEIRGVTLGRWGSWGSHGVRTRKSPGNQTALVPHFSDEKTTVLRATRLSGHTTNSPRVTSVLLVSALLHKFFYWAKKQWPMQEGELGILIEEEAGRIDRWEQKSMWGIMVF